MREISNFVDGEVTPEMRQRLERHFANCHHCSALLDGTRNVVALIADERALDIPDELSQRLYTKLSKYLKQ